MSNTVDFAAEGVKSPAVPAGLCVVYVEGSVCPQLQVRRIVWDGDPGFGRAELIFCGDESGAAAEGQFSSEEVFGMGRRVSIRQIYSGGIGQSLPEELSVFEGRIEEIQTRQDQSSWVVIITARDFGAELKRTMVYGRRIVCDGREPVFVEGGRTAFNEDGRPNAFRKQMLFEGRRYRMFAGRDDQSAYWTAAEAIGYLLAEYVRAGRLIFAGVEQLGSLTDGAALGEIDVTGLDMASALQKVCQTAGLCFCFEPVEVGGRFSEAIVFYRPGRRGWGELVCQFRGDKFNPARTNVYRFNRRRHYGPASVRFVGFGGFKAFEATFGLVKAWDPNLEGGGREMYSPLTNPDFESVWDVYRRWCLNEAGDYSGVPFDCGPAFDFGRIFGTGQYVRRRRRFEKALSRDSQGKSYGHYLEVSYDSGQSWGQYQDDFEILENQCGVWLSSDELSDDLWQAAVSGGLAFRITATVESDQRLRFEQVCGPVHSAHPAEDAMYDQGRRFLYRQVSPQSVFYPQRAQADTADDTAGLVSYVRGIAENRLAVDEELEVSTPVLELHWRPGQRVLMGPDSSDACVINRGGRNLYILKRAQADFEKQQTTVEIEGGREYR